MPNKCVHDTGITEINDNNNATTSVCDVMKYCHSENVKSNPIPMASTTTTTTERKISNRVSG